MLTYINGYWKTYTWSEVSTKTGYKHVYILLERIMKLSLFEN